LRKLRGFCAPLKLIVDAVKSALRALNEHRKPLEARGTALGRIKDLALQGALKLLVVVLDLNQLIGCHFGEAPHLTHLLSLKG